MNDEDLKAFEQWFEIEFKREIDNTRSYSYEEGIFNFACQHKQDEIGKIYKHLKNEHDLYKKHLKIYEDENAKLRECVEFYANHNSWQLGECVIETCDQENWQGGKRARQVLKELEEK